MDCGYSRCRVQFKLKFFCLSARPLLQSRPSGYGAYTRRLVFVHSDTAYELHRRSFTITSKSFPFVPLRGSNPQPARFFYLLKTFHGQSKEVTPVICVPLCLLELSGVFRYTCTPSICFCKKRSRLDNSYQYILLP